MLTKANQTSFKKGQVPWNKKHASSHEAYIANKPAITKRNRIRYLRMRFGISPEEYIQRLALQGNICPICLEPMVLRKLRRGTDGMSPVLDHNDSTKTLRQFVHRNCNAGMGLFNHDPKKLRRAADYLEKHHASK
jgi:hypothetical protein